MEERKGAATYKGQPVTLVGPVVKVGQRAPDFKAVGTDMQEISLSQSKGKIRLLSIVHSLDSPVCDLQTQLFEQEAAMYPNVLIYTISMDLPFTQARYRNEHHISNLKPLSDYKEASFGMAYGLLIKETRLLSRGVFIVDADDIVRYVEYVKEITEAPNYDNAIEALKNIVEECTREG